MAFWADRGRPLCSELVGGDKEKLSGRESAQAIRDQLTLGRPERVSLVFARKVTPAPKRI